MADREFDYWLHRLGRYIKEKRLKAGSKQEAVGARASVSGVERFARDPRLSSIIAHVAAVGGNISEVFESHVPSTFQTDHRSLHEMLEDVLRTNDPEAIKDITRAIQRAFSEFVESKTLGTDRQSPRKAI